MDDFILICIGILIAAVVLHKFYDKPFFPPEPKINPDEEKDGRYPKIQTLSLQV